MVEECKHKTLICKTDGKPPVCSKCGIKYIEPTSKEVEEATDQVIKHYKPALVALGKDEPPVEEKHKDGCTGSYLKPTSDPLEPPTRVPCECYKSVPKEDVIEDLEFVGDKELPVIDSLQINMKKKNKAWKLVEFVPKKGNGMVTEAELSYVILPKKYFEQEIKKAREEAIEKFTTSKGVIESVAEDIEEIKVKAREERDRELLEEVKAMWDTEFAKAGDISHFQGYKLAIDHLIKKLNG